MSPFLSAYFARTGWQQPVQVDIDTLRGLHLHHNCAIPFENIDVVLPREIHLDDGCLVDKLVTARRGGYCFEQNGLFERVFAKSVLRCAACWGGLCWLIRRRCRRVRTGCCWLS